MPKMNKKKNIFFDLQKKIKTLAIFTTNLQKWLEFFFIYQYTTTCKGDLKCSENLKMLEKEYWKQH